MPSRASNKAATDPTGPPPATMIRLCLRCMAPSPVLQI
jgi:hypothetical protein